MKISKTVFNLQTGHKYMIEMAVFNVQSEISPKSGQIRVTVHEFCTSCHKVLNLCEVSSKYLKRFPTYRADISI